MCGIAGFISQHPKSAKIILDMASIIRHRGPDDEGYLLWSNSFSEPIACGGSDTPIHVAQAAIAYSPSTSILENTSTLVTMAFGHRRLSIIDLSVHGHQPMCSQDRRYWIVYNGEVYNHIELKGELEKSGHRFFTHSDTEVILAAYAQWGKECLSSFNGMWGLAIYDQLRKEIFIARDRFGIKPLYYWCDKEGTFYFGSEIKQFTTIPGWQAQLNSQRAYDYLMWDLTDHTDQTLFSGVYQLPPGHFATIPCGTFKPDSKGKIPVHRWYALKSKNCYSKEFKDTCDEFKQLFTSSLNLRLRADVPLGSCLSGGLDSSTIVCCLNYLMKESGKSGMQKTFSACSDIERFDERRWINEVVSNTKVDAHYVVPTLDNLFNDSLDITWHQDEPFGSTSIYAQWNVFRLAAQNNVKVMLDGQGGDEVLAGYPSFFEPRLIGLLRGLELSSFWQERKALNLLHGFSISYGQIAKKLIPKSIRNALFRFRDIKTPSWISLDKLLISKDQIFFHSDTGRSEFDIQALSLAQIGQTILPRLLHYEDRNSMAQSIEARVPFLDYRLVEFALGLPSDYRLYRGITKRVLRSAMGGILPDLIKNRINKMGFETPEEIWVKEEGTSIFRQKIEESIAVSHGIISPAAIEHLNAMASGKETYDFSIWRMINFGQWCTLFNVKT